MLVISWQLVAATRVSAAVSLLPPWHADVCAHTMGVVCTASATYQQQDCMLPLLLSQTIFAQTD
jgi:hypothetical protein